jgi:HK97 family phage portal protein
LTDWFLGPPSSAGVRVSEGTAQTIAAVHNAVTVIASTVATTPVLLYERRGNARERATEHSLFRVLHTAPNPEMSPATFYETLTAHALLWGNAYAEVEENARGQVVALWPLLPDRTHVERVNGRKVIVTVLPDGTNSGLPARRVLHVPGPSFDGLMGRRPIGLAQESLGLTKATEAFGAGWFGKGARPAGVLMHPGNLQKKAKENLRKGWEEMHGGLTNAHRVALLEEGVKWQSIGVPPEDSQFLQTRKLQITEVARWFNLPPHKIKDLERATFSNIEAQEIEFMQDSMLPWFRRWEQAINMTLLTVPEQSRYFAEFLVEARLRADAAARATLYNALFMVGGISPNEIAARENLPPVEGGDRRFVPLNMVPVEDAAAPPPPAPPAPPPPAPKARPGPVSIGAICTSMPPPEMPVKALRAGTGGTVVARATIKGGKVVEVEILRANPRRLFDDAVREAMLQYTCNGDHIADQEFVFKVD